MALARCCSTYRTARYNPCLASPTRSRATLTRSTSPPPRHAPRPSPQTTTLDVQPAPDAEVAAAAAASRRRKLRQQCLREVLPTPPHRLLPSPSLSMCPRGGNVAAAAGASSSFGSVQPSSVGAGVAAGIRSLGHGVVHGLTGVVTDPIAGASSSGAWGFLRGVGSGLTGVVARPLTGALDLVSQTSMGLATLSTAAATPAPRTEPPQVWSAYTRAHIGLIGGRCSRSWWVRCQYCVCGSLLPSLATRIWSTWLARCPPMASVSAPSSC